MINVQTSFLYLTLLTILTIVTSGCTDDGGREFRSSCGAVVDGELKNPAKEDDGAEITVTGFANGNLVTVRERSDNELFLVLLHGLDDLEDDPEALARADRIVRNYFGRDGVFFRADDDCEVDEDGLSDLQPGQVFLNDGTNLSEVLLLNNAARIDTRERCSADLINACQAGLIIESGRNPADS